MVESVLAEWTALEDEKLQRRAEQLLKDRDAIDLTTLLPPPTSTLGGRTAKPTPPAATGSPVTKAGVPAASAVPAAPTGQAAAKSIVDSWMQLPSKPVQQPIRAPIRRPISKQPSKASSAAPPKQPPPAPSTLPTTAPTASSALPEPSTLVALGKAGTGRRLSKKPTAADEPVSTSTSVIKPTDDTLATPPHPPITSATDESATAVPSPLTIDGSTSNSASKSQPAAAAMKKTVALPSTARKSAQDAKLLATERAPITDDMLRMKAAIKPATDTQPSVDRGGGKGRRGEEEKGEQYSRQAD